MVRKERKREDKKTVDRSASKQRAKRGDRPGGGNVRKECRWFMVARESVTEEGEKN